MEMFMILATKPLNDGTAGFRFNLLGRKGIVRKRKTLSRGYKIERKKSMVTIHAGRLTIYIEHANNPKELRHFAG
jgi:hypothetical protein